MEKDKVIAELKAAVVTLRKTGSVYGGDLRGSLFEAAGAIEHIVIKDIEDGTWSRLYHVHQENMKKDGK